MELSKAQTLIEMVLSVPMVVASQVLCRLRRGQPSLHGTRGKRGYRGGS